MIEKIKIGLGKNSYDVVIGKSLIANAAEYIGKVIDIKSKIFIVTDNIVAKLHVKKLEQSLKDCGFKFTTIIIKSGEKSKSFSQLQNLLNKIFENNPERKSTIIAFGGGVVGDISGFAASILLRGINFVQIPTTLLAMVDSSVGGKTGINNRFGKNLIGSFYQPKLVLADVDLLKTLPKREILAGYAEIVKYGLINNKRFFEFLEKQKDFSKISYMIKISCQSKAKIVAADEKENNIRALLNLGHTFGHALEAIFKYDGRLLHGEAVAIGMVLALKFSEYLGLCKIGCADRLEKLLSSRGLKTKILQLNKSISANDLIKFIMQDKKIADGKLVFILANDIGESIVKKDVKETELKKFLHKIL